MLGRIAFISGKSYVEFRVAMNIGTYLFPI